MAFFASFVPFKLAGKMHAVITYTIPRFGYKRYVCANLMEQFALKYYLITPT